ncbi:hypothetical protein PPH41_22020 [Burkholderia gladioli]|nr:hypothetical protein [Burkholderia gladioli]
MPGRTDRPGIFVSASASGQVRLFLASIILFVISSWLCGLAPSLPFLLVSRVIQGAVAGPMIPLSP